NTQKTESHDIDSKSSTSCPECNQSFFGKWCQLCESTRTHMGKKYILKRAGPLRVALKELCIRKDNSLSEIKSIIKASKKAPRHVIRYFGLSRNPITNNYIIVMEYANQGNLHKYLVNNYVTLTWEKKLEILNSIASGLRQLHTAGLVHGALHSGN
ncbi:11746_t:CDS:2, partial [Dentiscutata heterogama]